MPTFNTLNGIISVQPSAHGFRATFNPYPMKDTIDEEEATEEQALASLVESLSNVALEAKVSCHDYLQKMKEHRERYATEIAPTLRYADPPVETPKRSKPKNKGNRVRARNQAFARGK